MRLEEYFSRSKVQKLEQELWDLTMNDSDIKAYTSIFSNMAILCPRMITSENKKVEHFIWGLSPQIQGYVIVANQATFDSAKRLAQNLIDHGVRPGIMTPALKKKKKEVIPRGSLDTRKVISQPRGLQRKNRSWRFMSLPPHPHQHLPSHIRVPTESVTSVNFTTMVPSRNCIVQTTTWRGTLPDTTEHLHNRPPNL